jgi:uncharacterized protein YndB with AHSA1/START domain
MRVLAVLGVVAAAVRVLVRAVGSGRVTIDFGVGRELQPLGPVTRRIDAPRETVFDVVAEPYLGRAPRALAAKLEVLDRGSDLVLAAHHTQLEHMRVTTVETVRFERPERIAFRLVRGPVPHVLETFELEEVDGGTSLTWQGELGTDFGPLGRAWGALVARRWTATVESSLDSIRSEAERRAA